MRRVVAALGGNAVCPPAASGTEDEGLRVRAALECLGPFLSPEVQLLVTHGNGPQVGHQLLRVERSAGAAYPLSLDVCVAQTQGELGFILARELGALLAQRGTSRPVAALVTQVVVDPRDAAFRRPSKPIGPALDEHRAAALRRQGTSVCEEPGRGLRRMVPSPEPRAVLELELVRRLLSEGAVVIAAGGGGIPVAPALHGYSGVEAVVDKDLTAALLADALGAELLLLVTDVPCAYTGFGTPAQEPIRRVSAAQARAMISQGHFGAGSMAPKIEACARFARALGRLAIVCDVAGVKAALRGEGGTTVVPEAR
jgi:carbamate kinase